MAQALKFGKGVWATKTGSSMAYSDTNDRYKPLPFNVERDSIATRVNKEGLIEVVGHDKLRIDYTDTDKGVALLENTSTNLIPYSNDFSQSIWAKENGGTGNVPLVTSNIDISPDGTSNADKIVFDLNGGTTSSDLSQLRFSLSSLSGNYTNSIYLKSFDGNSYNISILDPNGVLNTATITNEWKRFQYHNGGGTTSSNPFRIRLRGSEATSDNATLLIFGAMLEQNSIASSYIPTSGSAVQRAADVANNAGNSEVFNDSSGVLYLNINYKNIQSAWQGIALTNNNSADNRIFIGVANNTKNLEVYFVSGASTLWQPDFELSKINQFQKIALKYKANDLALFVNGFEVATNNSVTTMPVGLSLLGFFGYSTVEPQYGCTKEIGYYDEILTDAELETLTSYRSLSELVKELNLNTL